VWVFLFLFCFFAVRWVMYSKPLYPVPLAKDAAQHYSFDKFYVEWWYFDGVLNNDVHFALSFMIYAKGGNVDLTLFNLKNKERKVYHFDFLPKDIEVSKKKCQIRMGTNFVSETNGVYSIALNEKDLSATFVLTPILKGFAVIEPTWLGNCFLSWIVSAPRAKVEGVLHYDNKVFKGQGMGYHDHNYFPGFGELPPTGNWYWGRFFSERYTVVLAQRLYKKGLFGDAACLFIYKDGVLVEAAYGKNLIMAHSFTLNKHALPEKIRFKFKQFSFIINNIDISRREDFFVRFINDFSVSESGQPSEIKENGRGASEFVFL
jgi:hypothetical protein